MSKRCLFSPPQAWKQTCLASQVYLYSQEHSSALAQSHGSPASGYSLAIHRRGRISSDWVWQQRDTTRLYFCVAISQFIVQSTSYKSSWESVNFPGVKQPDWMTAGPESHMDCAMQLQNVQNLASAPLRLQVVQQSGELRKVGVVQTGRKGSDVQNVWVTVCFKIS